MVPQLVTAEQPAGVVDVEPEIRIRVTQSVVPLQLCREGVNLDSASHPSSVTQVFTPSAHQLVLFGEINNQIIEMAVKKES